MTGTERAQDDDFGDLKSDLSCASSRPGDLGEGPGGMCHFLGLGFSVCEMEGLSCVLSEVPFTVTLHGPWPPPPHTHHNEGYGVEKEGAHRLAVARPKPRSRTRLLGPGGRKG